MPQGKGQNNEMRYTYQQAHRFHQGTVGGSSYRIHAFDKAFKERYGVSFDEDFEYQFCNIMEVIL
jgi:hypothetical protein